MAKLDIIDEDENIIGEETKENIHKKGLLHREIHVWFYTPKAEIIFQLRSKHKDTFPNLLDATVGGHVEPGDDSITTALREMSEETGVKAKAEDLRLVSKLRWRALDTVNQMVNNVIRTIYAYQYDGRLSDLRSEEAQGFEAWPVNKLSKGLTLEEKKRFAPSMLKKDYLDTYREITSGLI